MIDKAFYIFRHGDTYETKNHLDYGKNILSSPVIPEARYYIEKMGDFLSTQHIDYLATSDIARCQQTSEIIGKKVGIPFTIERKLTEYDPASPFTPETMEGFISRIESFLSEMKKSVYKSIAVCCHGSGAACLTNLIRYNRFSEEELLDYPPPGVLWVINGERLSEKDFR